MPKKTKKKRQSTARRKAEQESAGGSFSTLELPEGMHFWKPKKGVSRLSLIHI